MTTLDGDIARYLAAAGAFRGEIDVSCVVEPPTESRAAPPASE